MRAARLLRWARRRAGLSQRQLADPAGVPQSTFGRIESGASDPRLSTLRRLLRACGFDLEVEPLVGMGVDRSQFRETLALTPERRIAQVEHMAPQIVALRRAMIAAKARRK